MAVRITQRERQMLATLVPVLTRNLVENAHLCAVLPGQYRSTAGSTAQKLILHSGCLSCFLYKTELELLTVWSQNRDALVVQRLTLRSVSKVELGRFPWGPCWWLFSFYFLLDFLPDKSFFLFSFLPFFLFCWRTIRFLLPLSLTPGACAPNHNHVFPFHIPSLCHR